MSEKKPSCYHEILCLLLKYEERVAVLEEKCEEIIDRMDLIDQEIKELKDWIRD